MSEKQQSNSKVFPCIMAYVVIVLLDLVCIGDDYLVVYRYITKPLILVFLIAFFLQNNSGLSRRVIRLMLAALAFSLIGDVLLLFDKVDTLFFIGGLVSFLMAHVFYIMVFVKKRNTKKKNRIFPVLTTVYAVVLFCVIQPGLNELLIPVVFYMIVILLMSNMAYLREGKVIASSYRFVFIGALFFMFSDSLFAINLFYTPLYMGDVFIMATYALAQFLIVYGVIKEVDIE